MVGFQLFSRRPCAGRQKQERFSLLGGDHRYIKEKK